AHMVAEADASPALPPGPLAGLKVLDLTDLAGALSSRLLGDLGADVVRVEPPGGAQVRHIAAHPGEAISDRRDRLDLYYNFNKRGVVLAPPPRAGASGLLERIGRSDILFAAGPPGILLRAGLDGAMLARDYPQLIHIAITPFGGFGPRSSWRGSDLV